MVKRVTATLTGLAAAAIGLAGCGGSDGGSAGAASVVPADVPLYIEASVNPDGKLGENLEALSRGLGELPVLGEVENPGELIGQQIDSALGQSGLGISYSEDIQPWLGERVAIGYFFKPSAADPGELEPERFVAALETTDEGAARDALDRMLEADTAENDEREYDGVTYYSSGTEDYAVGVFDEQFVLTTADEFELAVDTARGDESAADSEKLAAALDTLDEGRLGAMYVDLETLFGLIADAEDADAEAFRQVQEAVPGLFSSFALGFGIEEDQLYLESASTRAEGLPEATATQLLPSAPDDVIGAFGIADLGAYGEMIVNVVDDLSASELDAENEIPDDIREAFEEEVGLALDDVTAAIGDGTLWARGDLPEARETGEIEVGGQIEVSDEEVAATLLAQLGEKIAEQDGGKLKPPVSGGDIGFSIATTSSDGPVADSSPIPFEDGPAGDVLKPGHHRGDDLPFVNVEYEAGLVTYGFYRDRDAAASATPPAEAADFGETDAFARAGDLLGSEYELVGAADLGALVAAAVGEDPTSDEFGPSPEDIASEFLAGKLDVAAAGLRSDGDYTIQRFALGIVAGE